MKFVCEGVSAHSVWKSDWVKGRALFEFSVLFLLPKERTASCCDYLFNSFNARGWFARELNTLHSENFMDLFDDLRFTFIDDDGHGPAVDDMVAFICGCPEMCSKEKKTMFRLSCLRIGQFPPVLPSVKSGFADFPTSGPVLSEVKEPVQSFYCLAVLKTFISLIQFLLLSLLNCQTDPRVPHLTIVTML